MEYDKKLERANSIFVLIAVLSLVISFRDSLTLATISIGFLATLGGLLALGIKKEVTSRTRKYVTKHWQVFEKKFNTSVELIRKELDKKDKTKIDMEKVLETAEEIKGISEKISAYDIDLSKTIYNSVKWFFFAACVALIDYAIGHPELPMKLSAQSDKFVGLSFNNLAILFFLAGVYNFVILLFIWREIAINNN